MIHGRDFCLPSKRHLFGVALNISTTTRHHSANDFATFSATKILINEIMGGKTGSKLPFGIICRA